MNTHGWIPYAKRTAEQQRTFGNLKDEVPRYRRRCLGKLPTRCLSYDVQRKATGGLLLPRCYQQTGSCVGAIIIAYLNAQASDIVRRKQQEKIFIPFPFASWGIGREHSGERGPGEGSFGSAQAWAVKNFGLVPVTAAGIPKYQSKSWNGRTTWIWWTKQDEYNFSHPRTWPVPRAQLAPIAEAHQIGDVEACHTTTDVKQACADGKWPTFASDWGCENPRIVDGFLIGRRDTEWLHQESIGGYIEHPKLGTIFAIDNQWSPMAPPYRNPCPFLSDLGVDGTMWMTEEELSGVLANQYTECYVHADVEQEAADPIDWEELLQLAA